MTGLSRRLLSICISLILIFACGCFAGEQASKQGKISVFGSSVAKGHSAKDLHGYGAMLGDLLSPRGWKVTNRSRGGDTTWKLQERYQGDLLPEKCDYVLIGLSLANEGIRKETQAERDKVFEGYRKGLKDLIKQMRKDGMTPVVGLCYPHGQYTPEQYADVCRMNVLINQWDVPSINLLGSLDDGYGRWVKEFEADPGHPNDAGHREMYYSIVPTLLDALKAGKPIPKRVNGDGHITLSSKLGEVRCLEFDSSDKIHSWTIALSVRVNVDRKIFFADEGLPRATLAMENGQLIYN